MSSINIGLFVVNYNEYLMFPENVYSKRRCLHALNYPYLYVTSGLHRSVPELFSLLECYAALDW